MTLELQGYAIQDNTGVEREH